MAAINFSAGHDYLARLEERPKLLLCICVGAGRLSQRQTVGSKLQQIAAGTVIRIQLNRGQPCRSNRDRNTDGHGHHINAVHRACLSIYHWIQCITE